MRPSPLLGAKLSKRFYTRATMIHESTPECVFMISELTQVIASHLVIISKRSAVNLARASRYLEGPVLSTLWEKQDSLCCVPF